MHADLNPFRVQKIHRLAYRFPDGKTVSQRLESLVPQLRRRPVHAGIVAPHGCGKSTLLKEVQQELRQRGFETHWCSAANKESSHRIATASSLLTAIKTQNASPSLRTVTLLDSGENLSWMAWIRLRYLLRKSHLLATLHSPRRLPTWVQCEASPEVFLFNCRQLLSDSTVQDRFTDSELLEIYEQCEQNSRDAFFRLYEICSQIDR